MKKLLTIGLVLATAVVLAGVFATSVANLAFAQALIMNPPPTTTNTGSFNTQNSATQSNTITSTATGGNGGTGTNSNGGDATAIAAGVNQAAQSGAFGTSTSNFTVSVG
jgi:hypothetical protein